MDSKLELENLYFDILVSMIKIMNDLKVELKVAYDFIDNIGHQVLKKVLEILILGVSGRSSFGDQKNIYSAR